MKTHNTELISALLDGELRGFRRWRVARHVAGCAECTAEYRRLEQVRQLLRAHPVHPVMSDAPEFFWSKIKREIQSKDRQFEPVPEPRLSLADWLGQRQGVVATVAALAIIAGIFLYRPATTAAVNLASVERVATSLPDTTATAFQDTDAEVTVIWVTGLPWTKDMTEMQTVYASLDS